MPIILEFCHNCGENMRRIYVRDIAKRGNRFVALGVWCERCHAISPDPLTKALSPEGEYKEYTFKRGDREVTFWRPQPGTPLSDYDT